MEYLLSNYTSPTVNNKVRAFQESDHIKLCINCHLYLINYVRKLSCATNLVILTNERGRFGCGLLTHSTDRASNLLAFYSRNRKIIHLVVPVCVSVCWFVSVQFPVTLRFGAKKNHNQSEEFVCVSVIRATMPIISCMQLLILRTTNLE